MLHINMGLTIYILALAAISGAVFGSFINCIAWRMANDKSIWKGRSHCPSCGHILSALDLIPIVSYVAMNGKCRYCKAAVSIRYVATELFMAFVFVALVCKYDISFMTLRYLVLACILLALSLVDIDRYEIPNSLIGFGVIWWVITVLLMDAPIQTQVIQGLIGGVAIGGGVLLLSLIMDVVLKKESMGGGDIKLFFMLGLYMGPMLGLFHLVVSCLFGIVLVLVLKKNRIPFGPAMSLAALFVWLWGDEILAWYFSLF